VRKIQRDIPLKYVALSGGEPLLRPDFSEIVRDMTDMGIISTIITNGVPVTGSLLRRLPKGTHFEITLLGHKADLHNRLAGAPVFDRIVEHIAQIDAHRHHITTVFVAMKANALDIFRTAELAIALGANALMYNRINLGRGSLAYADELVPTKSILSDSLGLISDASDKYGLSVLCSVPIPACVVDPRDFPKLQFGWCPRGGDKSYYTVGYSGLLRPCNHSSLILGDLRQQGFAELISSPASRAFWRALPSECANCQHPLKNKCRGGCRAASAECYGTLRKIDPFFEYSSKSYVSRNFIGRHTQSRFADLAASSGYLETRGQLAYPLYCGKPMYHLSQILRLISAKKPRLDSIPSI
jgi:radical SAM protein with 4Fe4S-binding SPASM domain